MELLFRFAYPLALYVLVPLVIVLAYIRLKWTRQTRYRYSLGSELKNHGLVRTHPYQKILFFLRFGVLVGLALLIARPQLVDPQKPIEIEGINIIIALDISNSMNMPADEKGLRTRIAVAKEEAIRFVNKRDNDAIGLVLFANDAVSRCPLTVDKKILNNILDEVEIGTLDPYGTLLSRGLVTSLNRLRTVKKGERSNIVILLTDGAPEGNDLDPEVAIKAAKQLGIKIYTVGIGDAEQLFRHPIHGLISYEIINKKLLQRIADQTGGKFFLAGNPQDMRAIYDEIDKIEKVEQELPIFSYTYDIFMPFLWIIVMLFSLEILLSTLVWFSI